MITDWSGLTPLAIAQMSECSIRFLRAQRGPRVCLFTFCWRRRRWRARMFLMWLLGMRRVTPSFQIFLWEVRGSAREARRYAQDDCQRFGLGCVEAPPSQDKSLGFAISWPGFPGVSRSMSFWPWNWKYKAGLFLKFPGLFLKFPGLFLKFPGLVLKCPGIKGWPQHRREKGIELELWVGFNLLAVGSRSWGPPVVVSHVLKLVLRQATAAFL